MILSEARKRKLSLSAIFFTYCMDSLGWAIVFPIFAPFFLNQNNHLFSSDVSLATRTTVLGFFLTAFSLGQFLGAPLVGEYADRHGRKKALCLTVFFTSLGSALTAWSVQEQNLYFLFAGRLLMGLFAGNMTICLACIADLNEEESKKVKYFGYLSVIAGLSFILGAFVGGKISDHTVSSYFSPEFPLWIATGLSLANLGFVFFGFYETQLVEKKGKFDFLESLHNIKEALKIKKIKSIYSIYFLFLFAWTMLFQFTPVLVVRDFAFTNSNIGDLALFMGLCWALGAGYLNKILQHWFSTLQILETCLLIFTVLCGFLIFPSHIYIVLAAVAGCVIIGGLAWPLCNGLISSTAPRESQGKILGMSQSTQSLAMTLAPAVGGVVYQIFDGFPFLLGALASFVAGILYFSLKER